MSYSCGDQINSLKVYIIAQHLSTSTICPSPKIFPDRNFLPFKCCSSINSRRIVCVVFCSGINSSTYTCIYTVNNTKHYEYSKTCLQGTLRRGDTLWSRDTFSKWCPIFPMLKNLWWRDTCHLGTLSLGYWGVPWRQVLLYIMILINAEFWIQFWQIVFFVALFNWKSILSLSGARPLRHSGVPWSMPYHLSPRGPGLSVCRGLIDHVTPTTVTSSRWPWTSWRPIGTGCCSSQPWITRWSCPTWRAWEPRWPSPETQGLSLSYENDGTVLEKTLKAPIIHEQWKYYSFQCAC